MAFNVADGGVTERKTFSLAQIAGITGAGRLSEETDRHPGRPQVDPGSIVKLGALRWIPDLRGFAACPG